MSDAFWLSLFFPVLFFNKCSILEGDLCSEEQGGGGWVRSAHLCTALSHYGTVGDLAQLEADQQIIPYDNLNDLPCLGKAGT